MAKKKGTALVKWDEKFAAASEAATKGMALPAGKFISLKSGVMSYGGAKIPQNELQVVVVGSVYENAYYDPNQPYSSDDPQGPLCYAFGVEKDDMEPHSDADDKQNDACAGCPLNEFGSARQGKGKACKNMVRLAMIVESELEDGDLENAEIAYLRVPVTSVNAWIAYVTKTLRDVVRRPYWAVVTKIKVVPDDKTQFRLEFTLAEQVEDSDLFEPLETLWERTMDGIDFPYPKQERKPAKQPKGRAASKPAAGGKTNKFARR